MRIETTKEQWPDKGQDYTLQTKVFIEIRDLFLLSLVWLFIVLAVSFGIIMAKKVIGE